MHINLHARVLASGLLYFICFCSCFAQDIRFSQFYQAPLYLNPAFTGTSDVGRAGLNYRIQGTSSQSNFTTLSAFVDYNFVDYQINTGLLILDDKDEFSGYNSTTIAIPVSYDFQVSDWLAIKPALQFSYTGNRINFSDILFADQLDGQGNFMGQTAENFEGNRVNFFDVAFGTLVFGQDYWVGVAAHNLLENNITFLADGQEILQRRVSVHGGYRFDLSGRGYNRLRRPRNAPERSVMPSVSLVTQGDFTQIDIGLYATIEPVMLGTFYRNIPVGDNNNDAVSLMAGVRKFGFTFGYSYDYYLNHNTVSPGGAHEFSLTYVFDLSDPNKPPRSSRLLKCPLPI